MYVYILVENNIQTIYNLTQNFKLKMIRKANFSNDRAQFIFDRVCTMNVERLWLYIQYNIYRDKCMYPHIL